MEVIHCLQADKNIVSVLVPCRNERDYIGRCIESIARQRLSECKLDVIVVDGGSDDGTRSILDALASRYSWLRVINNPEKIVSTGLNRGIREAVGDIIVRIDVHTEYADDYIQCCVNTLRSTRADNVGGPWVARGTGYLSSAITVAFQSSFAIGGAKGHDPDHEGEVDTVYLGCWRKQTLLELGCFDEEFVRNQDDELNLRIRIKGGKIYQSTEIHSWYTPRSSLIKLFCQYFQYGYWKVKILKKHKRFASVRHLVPGVMIFWLISLSLIGLFSHFAHVSLCISLLAYISLCIFFSVREGLKSSVTFIPILPAIFVAFHFSYGFGFLLGVVHFFVFRRLPRASMAKLTR